MYVCVCVRVCVCVCNITPPLSTPLTSCGRHGDPGSPVGISAAPLR